MEPIRILETAKTGNTKIINLEKGKLPPQAVDLEEAVLGALMIDSGCLDEVMAVLKNSDIFYKDAHKQIFGAVKELYFKNEPIDILTVSKQLKKQLKLENVGGDYYLISLTQRISSSAHTEYHARILIQEFVKRQMIKLASEMIAEAYDDDKDIFDLLTKATAGIDSLNDQTAVGSNDTTHKEALQKIQDKIEILSARNSDEISGLHTGFKQLDLVTSGWQPTDLIVIAARPGMGKTSFILKTMLDNVKNDIPVGIVSLEMSTVQLTTRMVACNSHFHLNQLFRQGFEHTKYFQQFFDIKQKMEKYPAYYDDKSTDVYDVIAKIRKWKRVYGVKMVMIDYLQLMSCKSLGKNSIREQEISTITRLLKRLAKELNIPIILLSQLSRGVEDRGGDKRPMLKDLRESGAIEQDADVVAFIYRPSYYGIEPDDHMISLGANSEFIIAKHRNGSLDRIGLFFDENKTKFMDPDQREKQDQEDKEMINDVIPVVSAAEAFEPPVNPNEPPF